MIKKGQGYISCNARYLLSSFMQFILLTGRLSKHHTPLKPYKRFRYDKTTKIFIILTLQKRLSTQLQFAFISNQ